MPLQQFSNDDSLRAQRMTADEARSVIDLWQQEREEQTGLTDKPAVPDVAEGLDISVDNVQRLLGEVRARRVAEEAELAREQALTEIRLAEEERKLAELQRQRAELRREQAESERQRERTQGQKYVKAHPPPAEAEAVPVEDNAVSWELSKGLRDEEIEPRPVSLEPKKIQPRIQEQNASKTHSFGSHIVSLLFVLLWWVIVILFLMLLIPHH